MTTTADRIVRETDEAMQQRAEMTSPAKTDGGRTTVRTWTGRVMSGLVIAFLLLASAFPKFFLPQIAEESMAQLGWSTKHLLVIAFIELVGTVLYAIPRTAVLGALLLTGLLGGAVATHLRVENPWFSHTLFPLYVGFLMWGGLWLRNARLRALLSLSMPGKTSQSQI